MAGGSAAVHLQHSNPDAIELADQRHFPTHRQVIESLEDMEREEEEEKEEEEEEEEEEENDSDDEEETQIPIDDHMTEELPSTERETSPPPIQRRSSPLSPPLPMAEALAGSPPTGPPAANMSPFADIESTPQSNEDEDSRSETSSEISLGSGRPIRRRGARKRVMTACSDHRDLSERLKKAVVCNGEESFGESMIGADVVLCVTRGEHHQDAGGLDNTATNGNKVEGARRFHAHRFILAASSPPFRAMLTGNMRESSRRDVELYDIEPTVVEKMLVFMYTGDVVLDLESVLGLLIAAEMYELVALREMCKGFVLKYAHEVFCDPQVVELPEKILLELIPQDELQIRELALMEALVMWGESRVANAEKPGVLLEGLMEFVRFSTMSVSDLYGKVRPLVNDGVIREHLLTEALFNHLKWGSQTGVSAKRAKPRALAASLRKRKRVSFTQHVTFDTATQGNEA